MQKFFETQFNLVFHTQQVFRTVMDSMAQPGKVNRIPVSVQAAPEGLSPYIGPVCLTLLDSETSFYVENEAWRNYLRVNTGCLFKPAAAAEFVIASGRETLSGIAYLNQGTLLFPERGVTLMISVESIETTGVGGLTIQITGPGVPGSRIIWVSGLHPGFMDAITTLNQECPLGVDTILVDQAGSLACIPRYARLAWEENR